MTEEKDKAGINISFEGFDPFGLKVTGEISKHISQFGIDAAKAFLNTTCKPLLAELGLGGKDIVRNWRLLNIIKMLEKAQGKLKYDYEKENLVIDPRVAFQIVEHASIVSNETLQEMWAGLFAASCHAYEEDENIFFIDILKRLTSSQVKFLGYLCENSKKAVNLTDLAQAKEEGIVIANMMSIKYEDILSIMETSNRLKADSELNALECMGLIEVLGSFQQGLSVSYKIRSSRSQIRPSLNAILLYVKCKGSTETPYSFFQSDLKDFYSDLFRDYIVANDDDILETVYKMALKGKEFEEYIQYSSQGLIIQNDKWASLSIEELNLRLRNYLVFANYNTLKNRYNVIIDNKKFGDFTYKDGLVRL